MQKYELVLLLNASAQETERKDMLAELEKTLKDYISDKDDMGLLDLSYELGRVKGKNRAYFMSYYLQIDAKDLAKIREFLLYNNIVERYFIFKMSNTQPYFHFADLQKKLEGVIEGWDVKRFDQKISFFANAKNAEYICRKSIAMFNKYLTRFGNIKPRKYTGNSVSQQKKIRKAIIRSRELWLLEYIKS